MGRVSRARSHPDSHKSSADQQCRASAEERAGLRGWRRKSARASTAGDRERRAPPARCCGANDACRPRPTRRSIAPSATNAATSRPTARSDRSTHTTAATTPPAAPTASDSGVTCSVEQRRADRADPPRAQSVHDQLAVHRSRQRSRARRRDARALRPSLRSSRRIVAIVKPRRPQDPDLPQPLLDAQPEEQHRQQQRRHDEEEAEVGEVLAEVRRARASATSASRARRKIVRRPRPRTTATRAARSPAARDGSHRRRQADRESHRRGGTVARAPQISAARVGDERFRRRAIVVPVVLVLTGRTFDRSIGNGGSQSARLSAAVMPDTRARAVDRRRSQRWERSRPP